MLELTIPGFGELKIEYLVSDFNGTLAVDGKLQPGVREALNEAARQVEIQVITADTFGAARAALANIDCTLTVMEPGLHARIKRDHVRQLGAKQTIALGNGRNDRGMLETAAIGIAVLLQEGAASEAIAAADILAPDILAALAYFREPRRLVATLRG